MPAIGGMAAGSATPQGAPQAPPSNEQMMGPASQSLQNAPSGAQGMDMARQQLEGTMNAVRTVAEQVKALGDLVPMAGDEVQQIQQLLKSIVVKAAKGAPQQTMSGAMVPGGGGPGA